MGFGGYEPPAVAEAPEALGGFDFDGPMLVEVEPGVWLDYRRIAAVTARPKPWPGCRVHLVDVAEPLTLDSDPQELFATLSQKLSDLASKV